jgi:hypothetical protein
VKTKVLTRSDADIGVVALRAIAGRLELKGDADTSAKLKRVAGALEAGLIEIIDVGGRA